MVHEPAAIAGGRPAYWFPAGRVDAGETFVEAGERETLEEAGVAARVTGVLRFMLGGGIVPRVLLLAEPVDDGAVPKSMPDFESCGALWADPVALAELGPRCFRSPDTPQIVQAVAAGTLKAHSTSNSAFTHLEALVAELTKDDNAAVLESIPQQAAVMQKEWTQLRAHYPPGAFGAA